MVTVFVAAFISDPTATPIVSAQTAATPTGTPSPPAFDQAAALARLREQIKGREKEPASAVFNNIQTMKDRPASQLLAVMEFGYSRSLGVSCTHCHVPDKWGSDDKTQKKTTREMSAMVARINNDLLKNVSNLRSPSPTVNCTTCHRGQITPALDLN